MRPEGSRAIGGLHKRNLAVKGRRVGARACQPACVCGDVRGTVDLEMGDR